MDKRIKISYKKPLLWPLIQFIFREAVWGGVIMTWGDTIYTYRQISLAELIHESVHCSQHRYSKIYALWYFVKYTFSKKFRLKSETTAYRAELRSLYDSHGDRDDLRVNLAAKMASPLYNMVSYDDAYDILKNV